MQRLVIRQIILIICLLIFPFFISEVFAQVPPPVPQDAVPIDGLSFLAALGVLYGVKKLRPKKK